MYLRHGIILWLLLCLSSKELIRRSTAKCIFDEVRLSNPVVYGGGSMALFHNEIQRRVKKDIPLQINFQPLRIYVHISKIDSSMGESEQDRFRQTMLMTTRKAEKIFSVVRLIRILLLSRSKEACASTWVNTKNDGKCASIGNYRGEYCLDDFKIPDDHLEGLYVYDEHDPEPKVVYSEGRGMEDTDFVLYVEARVTERCVDSSTQAYASYCQIGTNNRPIAGYINMCPSLFSDDTFDEQKSFLVALHELFHALGFSKDMFGKFLTCNEFNCSERKEDDTWSIVQGATRLVTPKVVNATSQHFGCITHPEFNEFGPILETNEENEIKSHWDGAFMYSSIMAPTIGLPSLTVVDNITLAYFEDTGWYKVNYSYAQNFPWGEGGGCEWGLHPQCTSNEMTDDCFCGMPEERGCHYLRKSKGVCRTDRFLSQCYTYKSTERDSCLELNNSPNNAILAVTGEKYGSSSRCFRANVTMMNDGRDSMLEGRCYETRCNGSEFEVRVGSSWLTCSPRAVFKIANYEGYIECPEESILCTGMDNFDLLSLDENYFTTASPENVTSTATTYPPEEMATNLLIEIHFLRPTFDELERSDMIGHFIDACTTAVLRATGVASRRVQNMRVRRGSVIFSFELLPALYRGDGPPSLFAAEQLIDTINQGEFVVDVLESQDSYTAQNVFTFEVFEPVQPRSRVSREGLYADMVGVIVGSVLAVAVAVVAVVVVQRFYVYRSRRADRPRLAASALLAAAPHFPRRRATDSQHSSQSRASSHSRLSLPHRANSNHTVSIMMWPGEALERVSIVEAPAESNGVAENENSSRADQVLNRPTIPIQKVAPFSQQGHHKTLITVDPSTDVPSNQSAWTAVERNASLPPIRLPDISFDPASEPTPDSERSRQRTPVATGRKSRRISQTQSSTSRTSSGDRQPGSSTSSRARPRSRSRSRSSRKTRENSPFGQPRKNISRRSHSTRSTEKPRVRIREDFEQTNRAFEYDHENHNYYPSSPRPPRAIVSKTQQVIRNNSQTGAKPKLRNPRPRQMRRKTTQCVFSPRELSSLDATRKPEEDLHIDLHVYKRTKKSDNTEDFLTEAALECLNIEKAYKKAKSDCPLLCKNKKPYETATCPLQTPNCSKEDIKEGGLPLPHINPRDSDLSFTVDLKDLEFAETLSVYNAPRPENNMTGSCKKPVQPQNFDLRRGVSLQKNQTRLNGCHVSNFSEKAPTHQGIGSSSSEPNGPETSERQNTLPVTVNQTKSRSEKNGLVSNKLGTVSFVDPYGAPPIVQPLDQLPVMVPIIKLGAHDMETFQRASGSWRSFSSDTSLDSLSSPV